MTITYEYEGALYVNLTNKCNCNCEFCLRHGRKEGSIYTCLLYTSPSPRD